MSKRVVHIVSYFSLPTDLAASMRDWSEFKGGDQYSVDLSSPDGEVVTVRREEGDDEYVAVVGIGKGHLFDRVLGCVVHDGANCCLHHWRLGLATAKEL